MHLTDTFIQINLLYIALNLFPKIQTHDLGSATTTPVSTPVSEDMKTDYFYHTFTMFLSFLDSHAHFQLVNILAIRCNKKAHFAKKKKKKKKRVWKDMEMHK